MADQVEADYQALNKIASQFAQQASAIQQMFQKVSSQTNSLANGGWKGRGSDAFFKEMQDLVLPGVQRLRQSLEEASRVTKQVSSEMSKAEEEASSPFRAS
jgi:WXG100 family type VII secretion target